MTKIHIKIVLASFFISSFLFGCNTKTSDVKDSDKNVTDNKTDQTNTKTSNDNPTSNLFKVESVEKSTGKKIAPNFTWMENGKKMSLSDLKGKVVLINLWATWCGPCKKEIPDLSKVYLDMKDKNFEMIGLNIFQQEGAEKIEDFLKKTPIPYKILDGNEDVVKAFSEAEGKDIEAVPTTFIIDKEGKIVETIVGSRDRETFQKLVEKYLI